MRIAAVLVILIALTACNPLWNQANRSGLESDVVELLERGYGVDARPECRMVGRTRTGTCILSTSADQVTRLVDSLDLQEITSPPDPGQTSTISLLEAEGGCVSRPAFDDRETSEVYYEIDGRSKLRLSSGRAFEYLLLYHRPETAELCIQVSYAYG